MKMKDRVYRPGEAKVGTVVATSAEDMDVFEGETVDVEWDRGGRETILVEELERVAAHVQKIHDRLGQKA